MSVQSLEALLLANEARKARAVLKQDVAAGRLSVADVLADVPAGCGQMPILDLLMAQERWGRVRARRTLRSAAIPESKALTVLTDRQRVVLLALLGEA